MEGARFEQVVANRPDIRRPLPADFVRRLEGRTVVALRRRAKYLVAELSSGDRLVMHLGMSGSFRIDTPGREAPGAFRYQGGTSPLHDHVVFEMSSGATVTFNDPRRFGSMAIVAAGDPLPGALASLGPEPLEAAFTGAVLAAALHGKRTSLKAALSDQRVVAGLGNIYVSEALHRARLSPRRLAATLVTASGAAKPAATVLAAAIKHVLRAAVEAQRHGGVDRFRVYDREGHACRRRGCGGTIRRIVQGGRSTYYCPACQR
jgi:formamidopyrimidine-DNA glycosylase